MIKGVHTMFYSSEPEALRAFLRDKLGFPFTDVGEGWLIFDLPEADVGCHPSEAVDGARPGTHAISFYCDDVRATVGELRGRGGGVRRRRGRRGVRAGDAFQDAGGRGGAVVPTALHEAFRED